MIRVVVSVSFELTNHLRECEDKIFVNNVKQEVCMLSKFLLELFITCGCVFVHLIGKQTSKIIHGDRKEISTKLIFASTCANIYRNIDIGIEYFQKKLLNFNLFCRKNKSFVLYEKCPNKDCLQLT